MVAVHTQSEAQRGSIAGLAVNDSIIARRSCGGQFDFKKRDAVGLDTAKPHSRTTKVNLVHVEERVYRTRCGHKHFLNHIYFPQFDLGGPPEPALCTIVTTLASVFPPRQPFLFA